MYTFYELAGARIRELRETNRFTRERLAELAQISPKFLYEIETGQKGFSANTLQRIAKALSVNCDYILSGDETESFGKEALGVLKLFSGPQQITVSKMLMLIYELGKMQ